MWRKSTVLYGDYGFFGPFLEPPRPPNLRRLIGRFLGLLLWFARFGVFWDFLLILVRLVSALSSLRSLDIVSAKITVQMEPLRSISGHLV